MHTVVRFRDEAGRQDRLEGLGEELNRVVADTFDGVDSVPGRFSCDISFCDSWVDHKEDILGFLDECGAVVARAVELGMSVEFDVAIEPEDYENAVATWFTSDVDFLKRLAAEGVSLTFTVYYVGEPENQASAVAELPDEARHNLERPNPHLTDD